MRIQQHSIRLIDLVRDVAKGTMAPAAFQRPYVWTKDDALLLTESILRKYPIGNFLIWTPGRHADISQIARSRLGPIELKTEAASLLLDGQNRLASLAWLFRDETKPLPADITEHEKSVWGDDQRLVVNLRTETLEFVPTEQANADLRLPARVLVDSLFCQPLTRRKWTEWEKTIPDAEITKGLKWLDQAEYAFREAMAVATEMQNATIEEAKHAFLHICRTGVPMSEADFEAAVGWIAGQSDSVESDVQVARRRETAR